MNINDLINNMFSGYELPERRYATRLRRTKNHNRKASKVRRKMAKRSRRINRRK